MRLHTAIWFPVAHPFIRSNWSSTVISLSGIILKCISRLVYCGRIHIWSINIFVLLQFVDSYFRCNLFSALLPQPASCFHISPDDSPVPTQTRVTVLKPPIPLASFPLGKLRIWTRFSKALHTLGLFNLEILYSEVKFIKGQWLEELVFLCKCSLCDPAL